jgi:broad specificity phosphatase PhoE
MRISTAVLPLLLRAPPPQASEPAQHASEPSFTLISTSLLAQLLAVEQQACATSPLPPLRNRYFALRHGQSTSNVEGVISSNPAVGTVRHGLTTEGRLQARRAATRLLDAVGRERLGELLFVSSDFRRAEETAKEALGALVKIFEFESAVCLGDPERDGAECDLLVKLPRQLTHSGVRTSTLLRERWFGELDGTELRNYNQVWPRDLVSAAHVHKGAESVDAVTARVRRLVLELEDEFKHLPRGCTVIFSSHADTLQIAQCYLAGVDPRSFSMYRFRNGEVRELRQEADSLVEPVPLTYE